ncbi:MAG: ABC transporter permease [Thermomicrobiales bacterium]|nr:ABC transporter permease [Thermomicrobiales bacterium]
MAATPSNAQAISVSPPGSAAAPDAAPSRISWQARLRRWRRTRAAGLVGVAALAAIVLLAIVGPLLIPFDPIKPNPSVITQPPSATHWMGTDQYGRDIFARVAAAGRLDLTVAISVTALALTIGSLIGGVAGYMGGIVDDVAMRFIDVLLAFPAFILALGITAMLGNEARNVVIAVAIAYMPYFVRIVRGEMLSLREAEYAAAAKCVGNPRPRIMGYHLLPNALPPAFVQATLTLGWGILDVAGLSFLGVGIKPPTAEWGVIIGDGAQYINSGQWWISVFPGLAILITVLGFNLAGDWVRESVLRR